MTPYLFVYGTLLPDALGTLGTNPRTRLAMSGTYLGEAVTMGTLLDLGDYPGLVTGPGRVFGGVYRLDAPDATFGWLDLYEGITGLPDDEYRRLVMPVTCSDGIEREAWVYVMNADAANFSVIATGRWHQRAS